MKYPFLEEESLPAKLVSPVNISAPVHALIASGRADLIAIQESLSVRDMYNLLEIISVDNFNQRVWHKHAEQSR